MAQPYMNSLRDDSTMNWVLRTCRQAFLGLGLISLSACSSVESLSVAEAASSKYPIHGIDVSKYQGDIDWERVAKGGVRFVYLKATEGGDRVDDRFVENWNGSRAAGLPTGAYHFYYFCRPVEDQIRWFKTHVPPARDALPPVLDMEWNPQSPTCRKRPPADIVKRDMFKFLVAMERFYGKKPIIYTTVDFHEGVLHGDMHGYRYWLRSTAAHPSARYGERPWKFWQYTATGRVPGVRGKVDRNVFAGNEREWQSFLANDRTIMVSGDAELD